MSFGSDQCPMCGKSYSNHRICQPSLVADPDDLDSQNVVAALELNPDMAVIVPEDWETQQGRARIEALLDGDEQPFDDVDGTLYTRALRTGESRAGTFGQAAMEATLDRMEREQWGIPEPTKNHTGRYGRTWTGGNYDRKRTPDQIAEAMRGDFKRLKAAGHLPRSAKVTVKTYKGWDGKGVTVTIGGMEDSQWRDENGDVVRTGENEQVRRLVKAVGDSYVSSDNDTNGNLRQAMPIVVTIR